MKLLKKLVPAICVVGATLTVVPTIASCGDKNSIEIKIDQLEKDKYGSIFQREIDDPDTYKKTSFTANYAFELDDDLDDDDKIIVDSITSTSDAFKSVTTDDCGTYGQFDELVIIPITFKSATGEQLKVGDSVKFDITIKSKKGEVKKTTFQGLSFEMIAAPCDIDDASILDGLTGEANLSSRSAKINGFTINNDKFWGSIMFFSSLSMKSADGYEIIADFGTQIYVETDNEHADVAFKASLIAPRSGVLGEQTFTIAKDTEISILFAPLDSQIMPYNLNIKLSQDVSAVVDIEV